MATPNRLFIGSAVEARVRQTYCGIICTNSDSKVSLYKQVHQQLAISLDNFCGEFLQFFLGNKSPVPLPLPRPAPNPTWVL